MWCIYTLEYGMHAKSLSHIQLFVKLWTVACQAHLSMGFSRQESWDGLTCPPPGNLPNPGIEPTSLMFPVLASGFFTTSATWEALLIPRLAEKLHHKREAVSRSTGTEHNRVRNFPVSELDVGFNIASVLMSGI